MASRTRNRIRVNLAQQYVGVRHDAAVLRERLSRVGAVEQMRTLRRWERAVVAEWRAAAARLAEEERRLEERLDAGTPP